MIMSSLSYASYLSGHNDNPYHLQHIQEFRELSTMIAKEQIELYLPRIEAMVNNSVSKAMSNAFAGVAKATSIDVKRIVDVTCKQLNTTFHSEELTNWVAENLKTELENAFKNMDLKLILK